MNLPPDPPPSRRGTNNRTLQNGRLGPIIHAAPRAARARASRSTFLAIIRHPASLRCITALRARRNGPWCRLMAENAPSTFARNR
jgi:hypothetical protein